MKLDQIKATWKGYSTRKKWIVGGAAALLVVGVAEASNQDGLSDGSHYVRSGGGAQSEGPAQDGRGMQAGGAGYDQQVSGGYAPGGYAPPGGGYVSPATPSGGSGSVDIMSGWEANSKRTEDAERGADLTIRGQTDLRDTQTGEIVPEVPNEVANPAIASGAATEAPAAEVSSSSPE